MLLSFAWIALSISPPAPGMLKIDSMNSDPRNELSTTIGKKVAIGNNAGFRACLHTNLEREAPFRYANFACIDASSELSSVLMYLTYEITPPSAIANEGRM